MGIILQFNGYAVLQHFGNPHSLPPAVLPSSCTAARFTKVAPFNRPSRLSLAEVTWLQRPCSLPASHPLDVRIDGIGDNGNVTGTHRVWNQEKVGVFVSSLAEYKDRIYLMLPRVRGFV